MPALSTIGAVAGIASAAGTVANTAMNMTRDTPEAPPPPAPPVNPAAVGNVEGAVGGPAIGGGGLDTEDYGAGEAISMGRGGPSLGIGGSSSQAEAITGGMIPKPYRL